jgi:FkbM family methyltransferase
VTLRPRPPGLVRRPVVSAEPWPEGLFPLVTRGMDGDRDWLHGAEVSITPHPAGGLRYDTRDPIPYGWWPVTRWDVLVALLVPPGAYDVSFRVPDYATTQTHVVVDPLADLTPVEFRDGAPIWLRPGTWDEWIVDEAPYGRLPIPSGSTVLDLGAHIGTFTRDALRRGATCVVACEPEPTNFELLRRNTIDLPVISVRAAVTATPSPTVRLWLSGDSRRNALHSTHKATGNRVPIDVPAVHFQQIVTNTQPTVMKVDVEWCELEYDWSQLPDSLRSLAVELESPGKEGDRIHTVVQTIESQGFEPIRSPGESGWSTLGIWAR